GHAGGGPCLPTDQVHIGLESGEDEKQHHPEARQDLEEVTLHDSLGNNPLSDARKEAGQQRRSQYHTGQDLADDGGLAESGGDPPEQSGREQQDRELDDELKNLVVGGSAEDFAHQKFYL